MGGNGGKRGNSLNDPTTGLAVKVNSTGSLITTSGTNSTGILAQSIGGGGGNGGISLSLTAGSGPQTFADVPLVSLGCKAGGGGNAGAVLVENSSNIFTTGDYAAGILAQSVGGGGGTGGSKITGSVSFSVSEKSLSMGLSLGASGVSGARWRQWGCRDGDGESGAGGDHQVYFHPGSERRGDFGAKYRRRRW